MDVSRRALLRRLGVTGLAVSLAGCSSDGDSTATTPAGTTGTTPAGTTTPARTGTTTEMTAGDGTPMETTGTDVTTTEMETTTDAEMTTQTTTEMETTTETPMETTTGTPMETTTTTTSSPPSKTGKTAQEEYPDYDWSKLDDASATSTSSITAKNSAFDPLIVEVSAGTTVTWSNDDNYRHSVTMPKLGVDEDMSGGGSVSVTFAESGTYDYVCIYHPTAMLGRVVVN